MRNKKLRSGICIFLAVLLLFTLVMGAIGSIGAAAVDQSDIDALERQKEEITAQKNSVSVQIAELQQKQATVLEQKAALDEQNELTRQQIELITEQIELYDDLIAEKEQELEEAIDREEYQKERFEERVRAMEETVCGRGLAFDKRDVFPEGCGHSGFTGTSIYFSRAHDIGAVLLTNRLCRTSQEPANMQDVRRALHYALLDREPPQVV